MARTLMVYVDNAAFIDPAGWRDAVYAPQRPLLYLREALELRVTAKNSQIAAADTFKLVLKHAKADTTYLATSTTQSSWSALASQKVGMTLSLNTAEAIALFASQSDDVTCWFELLRTTGGLEDIVASGEAVLRRDTNTGSEGNPTTATPQLPEQLDFAFYAPGNETIILSLHAKYTATIAELTIKSAAGTCTLALQKDGVNVTGLGAVSVSNVEQTVLATALNVIAAGETLQIVLTSVTNLTWLYGSIKLQRP